MKKTFLVVTEKGRKKHLISFYIAEVNENGLRLIDNDFTCSINSNKGLQNEALSVLIKKNELPSDVLDDAGYKTRNDTYNLIIVVGTGLNYVS